MIRAGFVGLGAMGLPMALNVLRAGFPLIVFNRRPEPLDVAVRAGATAAASPAEVARAADVVCVCVSDDAAVETVVAGADGLLAGAGSPGGPGSSGYPGSGVVVVDHSTVAPATTRRLSALAAKRGVGYLDAPVSGGQSGARQGSLTVMVGGHPGTLERVRPVLDAVAARVVACGPPGSGNVAKLVNNLLAAANLAVAAEALALGAKAGVDPAVLYEVVRASSGRSAMLDAAVPRRFFARDFAPGFRLDLMAKDLGLAQALADAVDAPADLGGAVAALYRRAQAAGLGNEDVSAVVRVLEERAGVEIRPRR